MSYALSCDQRSVHYMFEVKVRKSPGSRKPAVHWAESFSQLGSGMLAGPIFRVPVNYAGRFLCCFVKEESWVSGQTVILSKRVCECLRKRILRVGGMRRSLVRLYPGPKHAARWSVSVGPVYIMFVLVTLPFVSVVGVSRTLFLM